MFSSRTQRILPDSYSRMSRRLSPPATSGHIFGSIAIFAHCSHELAQFIAGPMKKIRQTMRSKWERSRACHDSSDKMSKTPPKTLQCQGVAHRYMGPISIDYVRCDDELCLSQLLIDIPILRRGFFSFEQIFAHSRKGEDQCRKKLARRNEKPVIACDAASICAIHVECSRFALWVCVEAQLIEQI